jgi:hypothetical protein
VRELPPESAAERAARHDAVARRRAQPVLVILHRGASGFAPENTLEAYAAAMDRGADGCEFDIRRSADGVLYLHHDDDLGRVFEGGGPASALTYYELLRRPIKAPYGAADATTRMPTLAAFLALARQRAMLLHLDIKEPGLDDDIKALLDAADVWDHVVSINDYNSEKLRTDPRLKLLAYKGWFPQPGSPTASVPIEQLLARPGRMVIMDDDPAPAAAALKRAPPASRVPVPRELREKWRP